jgi:uncharacterized membrane protein
MSTPDPSSRTERARELWGRVGWLCVFGLFLLQVLWQSLWPAPGFPPLLGMLLALLPLLPLALACLFRLQHQLIYAGIGVLIYFCHGVMECYANPARRPQAVIEIVLSVTYFAALYMRRRAGGRAST